MTTDWATNNLTNHRNNINFPMINAKTFSDRDICMCMMYEEDFIFD